MRLVVPCLCASLLTLSGCSMMDHRSSENVQTAYVGPSAMNEQQVTQLLHEQGYGQVSDLHKNGSDWVGAATTKDGSRVDFDIDKDGVIHTK